jgi:hypothetical protein
MLCSLNEIEMQVRKAVRGAGYGWGLAEEAGKAARWLSCHEYAAVPAFLGLCTRFDRSAYEAIAPASPGEIWTAPGGMLCPLIAGVTLRDFAPDRMESGPMALPVIFGTGCRQADLPPQIATGPRRRGHSAAAGRRGRRGYLAAHRCLCAPYLCAGQRCLAPHGRRGGDRGRQ